MLTCDCNKYGCGDIQSSSMTFFWALSNCRSAGCSIKLEREKIQQLILCEIGEALLNERSKYTEIQSQYMKTLESIMVHINMSKLDQWKYSIILLPYC